MRVEPGTYDDVAVVGASVYEAPSGAVMCLMKFENGLQGGICLIQKDGTLSERGFKDVQTILGWSDWDWARFDADPETFTGTAQIVVEDRTGDSGKTYSSIKYVNAPGGNGRQLEKGNAKSLAAKYGAKTRALFGGAPAGSPAKPTPPPAPKKAPPPPPAATFKPSTMEICWDEFCQANSNKTELELYSMWPALILKATGKDQNDCTPEDWGKVSDAIAFPA
jgi:hypothetical protein